jgi:hypothetical protein
MGFPLKSFYLSYNSVVHEFPCLFIFLTFRNLPGLNPEFVEDGIFEDTKTWQNYSFQFLNKTDKIDWYVCFLY